VIIVDGEEITPWSPDGKDGGGPTGEEIVRAARLELKLCKALVALNPPHGLSVILYGRIAQALRVLSNHDAADPDARQATDLDDDELRQAAEIVRAIRALPAIASRIGKGGHGLRFILTDYALDLVNEIDKRGRDKS
jgi:hypothetical protein